MHRERPGGSPRNVWPGTVREITAGGSRLRVLIAPGPPAWEPAVPGASGGPGVSAPAHGPGLVAEITTQAAAELGLEDGTEVFTSVKATETTVVAV